MTDIIEMQNYSESVNEIKENILVDGDDNQDNCEKNLLKKSDSENSLKIEKNNDNNKLLESLMDFKKFNNDEYNEENYIYKKNDKNDDDNGDLLSNNFISDNLVIGDSGDDDGDGVDDELNDDTIGIGPTSERWAPLGADNEETTGLDNSSLITSTPYYHHNDSASSSTRIKSLEEEQEILTTSLMALTSHFAQVQFRLRQIVEAPPSDRDQLLVNLEEFAFRGIPEITGNLNPIESEEVISNLERARQRQFELIDRLKRQLSELEKFAYESGAPVLPQSIIFEKQKIIIDELKNKLNLNVSDNDLPQLSTDELRNHVDTAIGEFVGPLKMKEQLVAQLKTQITDLERFIAFLQGETTHLPTNGDPSKIIDRLDAYNSYAAKKKHITQTNTMNSNTPTGSGLTLGSINKSDTINRSGSVKKILTTPSTATMKTDSKKSERNKDCMRKQHYKDNFSSLGAETSGSTTKIETDTSSTSNNDATYSIGSFTKAHNLLDKAATLLQMFAVAQFGCGSNRFQKNTLKKTTKCNHWGDLRAQLEVDIQEIISLILALQRDQKSSSSPSSDDSEYEEETSGSSCSSSDKLRHNKNQISSSSSSSTSHRNQFLPHRHNYRNHNNFQHNFHHSNHYQNNSAKGSTVNGTGSTSSTLNNIELTTIVRKNFAVTLQKLIQHGLRIENETATNLVPFIGCLNPTQLRETSLHNNHYNSYHNNGSFYSNNSSSNKNDDDTDDYYYDGSRQLHAWELILEYYNIKNGDQYNETPARKLSQSFNLDIVGGTAISNKQSLLSIIGSIIAMHSPYKRSYNSHFKAFVCAGLNSHKLVQWLNLIFQCNELIEIYYTNWSYVAKTGFRDSLKSIDRLTKYDFDLPVDLAIRQFQNIKDVFM